ncbi:MAG: YfhO family protein, partial [Clostridia bacterium]|nr:YfhO family protein [Clostridia bacterium]
FYLPSRYPREVALKVNGSSLDTFYGNETTRIVSLGHFSAGQQVRITLTIKQDNLYVLEDDTFFYSINMDTAAEAFARLAEGNYMIDADYSESHFTGTISTTENASTVFTTIPYDEGWTVRLDGEKVETYKTLDALIAFDTTPGTHTLELKYEPKAFTYGLAITVGSTIIFIALCIIEPLWRRRFPMVPVAVSHEEELDTFDEIAAELDAISPSIPAPNSQDNEE